MTDFEDIDDFIEDLEQSVIEQAENKGITTSIEDVDSEFSRLRSLDKEKFSEENQIRIEARIDALRQVKEGDL